MMSTRMRVLLLWAWLASNEATAMTVVTAEVAKVLRKEYKEGAPPPVSVGMMQFFVPPTTRTTRPMA